MRIPRLLGLSLLTALMASAAPTETQKARPEASSPSCPSNAFLTFEQGKLASVDWVIYTPGHVHTHVLETQSHVIDATVDLNGDGTATHSSVEVIDAGEDHGMKQARDLGEGAIYWSPRVASSIEQAVIRAKTLGQQNASLPGASLFSDVRTNIVVERLGVDDWTLQYQDKHYNVLTDEQGCVLSATLPEYGVTIERRKDFQAAAYPLWPAYAAPPDGAYTAIEVKIAVPAGHVLAGTLTLPKRADRIPAAVLITGLSPHERNNGSPPWMPFRDIADSLTRAGIAVLRLDDRGVGKSTGDAKSKTVSDKVADVSAGVAWLRQRADIDPNRIALVGYSEGGLIAPMIAAKDSAIAALVTLAGPGVSGPELARYQVEQPILRDVSLSESQRKQEIEKQYAEALKDLSPHEKTFMAIDPLVYDRQVHCPALIIQGGADASVPVRSAERIASAMRAGGNPDVTVRIFPGVSHSLLPDPGGLPSGWGSLPGFLTTPALVDEVASWTVARLHPRTLR